MPTTASLRLQAYTDLAYGAQALQFFTYWTPPREAEGLNYHEGPISAEGKKTKTYDIVKKVNRELQSVSRLFYGSKVLSVHHLGQLSKGATRLNNIPTNLQSLKIVSVKGAVISTIEKEGCQYLAIVNKDYLKTMRVHVKARNSIPTQINKNLKEIPLKSKYIIEPGDILLIKLTKL